MDMAIDKHMVVSMGYPNSWLVYNGKYDLFMDDDWGYPHFKKSSILMGCSFINHLFLGTPIDGNPHMAIDKHIIH